jgi:hypothetical protein
MEIEAARVGFRNPLTASPLNNRKYYVCWLSKRVLASRFFFVRAIPCSVSGKIHKLDLGF